MKNYISLFLLIGVLFSCNTNKEWKYQKTIDLGNIHPVGITIQNKSLILSDTDNQRLVWLDENHKVIKEIEGLDRPMHIESKDLLWVANYGTDEILIYSDSLEKFNVPINLDAPSGIAVQEKKIAIADFYNHQIPYFDGSTWKQIGKKGKKDGEFHYPTDVQFYKGKIYVADAYNHRIQVFDLQGNFLFKFGMNEKMNASTGVYVNDKTVYVTDFENGRVIIYDTDGKLLQILKHQISSPTDLIVKDNTLYILNYKEGKITIYK